MVIVSGLLAMTMVAADGPSCPPVETTTYQVRVLTLDGLDWRTSSYSRLQQVARQGASTIWTADRSLAASLVDRAKASSPGHAIVAVGEAVMTKADTINYVAAMGRVADGPMNQSSTIAFVPRVEQVEERFSIKVEGRKLDQGILTKIALEETHVDVIHGVPQTETLVPPASRTSKGTGEFGKQILNVILSSTSVVPEATTITSSVQIPEVTRASVAGEWLIPNDGVLLVSLGVKTAADAKGMAVVRERVAVIEARTVEPIGPDGGCRMISAAQPGPFQHTKLGQPVVPGRSMPEAIDPSGKLIELPPLPEALASADLDRIKPEPYQPSPQAPIQSAPSADPALARTSYDAAPAAPKCPVAVDFEGLVGEDIPIELVDIIGALLKAQEKGEMGDILLALLKAGVKIDKAPDMNAGNFFPASVAREKCVGDPSSCPANAPSMNPAAVAGGMKLASEGSPRLGARLKISDGDESLEADVKLEDALKAPGKTETTLIPLGGGKLSLEIKTTVVPAPPEPAKAAAKKAESPATRR